eukprot:2741600-Amphidinium_carterae.1
MASPLTVSWEQWMEGEVIGKPAGATQYPISLTGKLLKTIKQQLLHDTRTDEVAPPHSAGPTADYPEADP